MTSSTSSSSKSSNPLLSTVAALTLLTNTLTVLPQTSLAAVAPLADVGLREFLVKDSSQHIRLSLPSSMKPGTPIDLVNDEGRKAQEAVELVRLRLEQVGFAGKPQVWNACLKEVNTANSILSSSNFLNTVPANQQKKAKGMLEEADKELENLRDSIRNQDPTSTLQYQDSAAQKIYSIRLLSMPPQTLPYTLPSEFSGYPILQGLATVSMEITHPSNSPFTLSDGTKSPTLPLTLTIDGYRSPVTSGNFLSLVKSGVYTNIKITDTNDLFVNTSVKSDKKIPLELFYKKDTKPTYHYSSDDDLRATEAFADPFQAKGALGMIHDPEDVDSGKGDFFFLKWDQGLVAPGRNTLDGSSTCFGYVTRNQESLEQIRMGDVISKAVVVEGLENLSVKK
ncbi:hypothetical protein TrST_g4605 [Triparma strigata]|uniref:peptidylprolyl isomerase n=1 Tax=Triparma strigata TaxID=1606541 RepID=A0A9W7DUP5_9STRA|nr:hypothetical protein TrST_g4605 [Triparma strigata]